MLLPTQAFASQDQLDLEDLENRAYDPDDDASLLRFLVDMKGESASTKDLRDDLMTMLIAGHETTAALLTWTLYEVFKSADRTILTRLQDEVSTTRQAGRQANLRRCHEIAHLVAGRILHRSTQLSVIELCQPTMTCFS